MNFLRLINYKIGCITAAVHDVHLYCNILAVGGKCFYFIEF